MTSRLWISDAGLVIIRLDLVTDCSPGANNPDSEISRVYIQGSSPTVIRSKTEWESLKKALIAYHDGQADQDEYESHEKASVMHAEKAAAIKNKL